MIYNYEKIYIFIMCRLENFFIIYYLYNRVGNFKKWSFLGWGEKFGEDDKYKRIIELIRIILII